MRSFAFYNPDFSWMRSGTIETDSNLRASGHVNETLYKPGYLSASS
jgi:hypothetical protein